MFKPPPLKIILRTKQWSKSLNEISPALCVFIAFYRRDQANVLEVQREDKSTLTKYIGLLTPAHLPFHIVTKWTANLSFQYFFLIIKVPLMLFEGEVIDGEEGYFFIFIDSFNNPRREHCHWQTWKKQNPWMSRNFPDFIHSTLHLPKSRYKENVFRT